MGIQYDIYTYIFTKNSTPIYAHDDSADVQNLFCISMVAQKKRSLSKNQVA
jgi:hypothetical protein